MLLLEDDERFKTFRRTSRGALRDYESVFQGIINSDISQLSRSPSSRILIKEKKILLADVTWQGCNNGRAVLDII